jgi:hypothetical protein
MGRKLPVASTTSPCLLDDIHHWQPGNIYGGYSNPEYNALSYTWGRWKLNSGQLDDVASLNVHGIDKWSIPRIDPAHFSVNDFKEAIHTAANANIDFPVEFVWVDVACIDQRESSLEMASEIGRQARIFKGANDVFIWLTKYNFDELHAWATSLERCSTAQDGMKEMVKLIDFLRRDPWLVRFELCKKHFCGKMPHSCHETRT